MTATLIGEARSVIARRYELIRRNRDARHLYYTLDDAPIDGVIPKNMRSIIIETDSNGVQRVNRISYEIAVLDAVRKKIRCKEIWLD